MKKNDMVDPELKYNLLLCNQCKRGCTLITKEKRIIPRYCPFNIRETKINWEFPDV